jgi:hypothetical protein
METILFVEVTREGEEDAPYFLCIGHELTLDSTCSKNTEELRRYTTSGLGVCMVDEIAYHIFTRLFYLER